MTQTNPAPQGGPYLQIAAICEQVIEGKDGVLSLIRVIDRVNHQAGIIGPPGMAIPPEVAAAVPEEMPPFVHNFVVVISFKVGEVRGSHQLRLDLEKPDMTTQTLVSQDVFLEGGEDRGVNVVNRMVWQFDIQGLHWFNVYFDNSLMAKMPMRIVYLRR